MSLGDTYTLGVRLTGDISSLRQELAQGSALLNQFSSAAVEAMTRAAAAIDRSAAAFEQSSNRVSTATRRQAADTQNSTRQSSTAFDDYMRRATAANQQVATSTEQSTQRTVTAMGGMKSSLLMLTGFGGFALLAKQVWDVGIGFHTFTQNMQVALTTMLGTEGAAKTFLADILTFAKQTPYAFTDLTNQAQKLLSYGIQSQQVIPILTAIGDASTAMGKGADGLQRLGLAIGQINAKGRLQSQELLQLSEGGINGLKILANQANMTTIDFQKLIEKGLVPSDVAIKGLVKGIEEGTDGINGQTAAFGGLMEKIKSSGGITATLDAARTGFRNAAAAITDSLVPAYTGFLQLATRGLGVLKQTANVFNGLDAPVQSAALAMGAAAIAVRLLNVQGRASAVWSSFSTYMATARVQTQQLSMEVGRARAVLGQTRAMLGGVGAAARGVGSALLGAFGGPVGLAITAAAAGLAAFASSQAKAKAEIDAVAQTLDEATGKITENTREWAKNKLASGNVSAYDSAEKLGVALDVATDAALGNVDALKAVKAATEDADFSGSYTETQNQLKGRADALGLTVVEYQRAARALRSSVSGSNKTIEEAIRIAEQKQRADKGTAGSMDEVAKAYDLVTNSVRDWSDEEIKSINSVQDAAEKAFSSALKVAGTDLDLSTADDVANAREKVSSATKDVRDAEVSLQETRGKKKASANDIVRAEEAVTDARKKAQDAANDLADTEARRDPVAQYRKKMEANLKAAQDFTKNVEKLGKKGLNATDLLEIINAGPTGSKDTIDALLGDKSLIKETNKTRVKEDKYEAKISDLAGLAEQALLTPGSEMGDTLALAFKTSALKGTEDTVAGIAKKLGEDPQALYDAGMAMGLSFLSGLSDATQYQNTIHVNADGSYQYSRGRSLKYASGGIYPGYTPGRDTGMISVGGGEAIMRPEWTRAVGSDFVHRMNAIARGSGVNGVQAEMRRYLGGYASGGVVPTVVQVPVSQTIERNTPWTIQQAYFTDPSAATQWGDRARARANTSGRR